MSYYKTLVVSLISDQTLPNVQLIKEYRNEVSDYLFISTEVMEKRKCREWIENTTSITSNSIVVVVDEYDIEEIKVKLNAVYDYSIYDRVILNLTGGTKIMTLAVYDFFRDKKAEVKYVSIQAGVSKIINLNIAGAISDFKTSINIFDYLKSYGFSIKESKPSGIDYAYTQKFFKIFCNGFWNDKLDLLSFLRSKRDSGVKARDYHIIETMIKELQFPLSKPESLSRSEVKYLTGEWFEEYVGLTIKKELNLKDDEILIGTEIEKKSSSLPSRVSLLLGDIKRSNPPKNEFDVMFVYKNRFYTIECKTSIINKIERVLPNGEIKQKDEIILGETIYKSDSLRTKFGLYATSYILTLTDFRGYIEEEKDLNKKNNRTTKLEGLIDRADLSKIKIVDGIMLRSEKTIKEILEL